VAKLLRLDVAQLTDVGRKREHNEDNMAYVIPKDALVMARKGALFIVADGMGGHAAGEVASEIAVDTVSNTYYQDDNDDVPTSLLFSIRRANAAIHQRAAENMLRSGMGTTCVAAVLRGNVAYVANVGDSRAYLVRGTRMRQVSQDHSWVAEQVRAGLLTEEQARTHAQRNVITRSLGTQTEVEIDIFREVLEEGDTLLLCSDGLSGFVMDEELQHSVEQFVPQESVYHLVERANENGGGDNITAIVARVQEVGIEPPNMRQPVPVGGPEVSNEDTARLFAPASAGLNMTTRNGEMPMPGSPFPYTSSPLASAELDTAPQNALQNRKRTKRLFYPALALLVLLVLIAGSAGLFYFQRTNQAKTITQTLTDAGQLINQAKTEVTNNPMQALQSLSSAQGQLENLSKNYSLTAADNTTLSTLQTQLVNETRAAITNYNQAAQIALLPCTTSTPNNLNNGATQAQTVAIIQNAANNTTPDYVLAKDSKIYQLTSGGSGNQYTLSNATASNANLQFISMVGAGDKILALSEQVTNNTPGNYAVNVLTPGDQGILSVTQKQPIATSGGQAPTQITVWGNRVFVVLSSSANQNTALLLGYTLDDTKNTFTFSGLKQTSISVTASVAAITAFPEDLFLLLADGEVLSSQIHSDLSLSTPPTPVLTSTQITTPLTNETQNFVASNPVPTAPQTQNSQKGNTPLKVIIASDTGNSGEDLPTMSAGKVKSDQTDHLFIGEPANHRVLDLIIQPTGSSGGPGATPTATQTESTPGSSVMLSLVQQYVSPTYFNTIKSVALDPGETAVDILGQNISNTESLVVITPGAQQACSSAS
jgi:serine/threonine protein phosphatase PrpC